jgi:amidohydrolase
LALTASHIELLTEFRRELHQNPYVSLEEAPTIDRIATFLEKHTSGECIRIADGRGLVCRFESGVEGPELVVRADVDALPISERSGREYASQRHGVAHSCGHDGHSAILCGLAISLSQNLIQKGSVTLLFQPAEEIGQGAQLVLHDAYFRDLKIDQIVALHNIPGSKKGRVLIREGVQCAASTGVIIKLKGETAHAATPESGKSPIKAMMDVTEYLNEMSGKITGSQTGFGLRVTIAGMSAGGPSFGVSPGFGTVWATLRTLDTHLLNESCEILRRHISEISKNHGLEHEIELTEHFDATQNDSELVQQFTDIIRDVGYEVDKMDEPFSWSEDFGKFTSSYSGFLFGLGAGEHCHPLHHSAYDFPDEIIPDGVHLFETYIRDQLK